MKIRSYPQCRVRMALLCRLLLAALSLGCGSYEIGSVVTVPTQGESPTFLDNRWILHLDIWCGSAPENCPPVELRKGERIAARFDTTKTYWFRNTRIVGDGWYRMYFFEDDFDLSVLDAPGPFTVYADGRFRSQVVLVAEPFVELLRETRAKRTAASVPVVVAQPTGESQSPAVVETAADRVAGCFRREFKLVGGDGGAVTSFGGFSLGMNRTDTSALCLQKSAYGNPFEIYPERDVHYCNNGTTNNTIFTVWFYTFPPGAAFTFRLAGYRGFSQECEAGSVTSLSDIVAALAIIGIIPTRAEEREGWYTIHAPAFSGASGGPSAEADIRISSRRGPLTYVIDVQDKAVIAASDAAYRAAQQVDNAARPSGQSGASTPGQGRAGPQSQPSSKRTYACKVQCYYGGMGYLSHKFALEAGEVTVHAESGNDAQDTAVRQARARNLCPGTIRNEPVSGRGAQCR